MIKFIFYQFNYSKKVLIGIVPLLLVSSLIVGTSIIGIHSASKTAITSIQLFQMLIFFGGVTLFFLISNVIQFFIDIFRDEYQLWSILGASHFHIALIISGQLFTIALLTSILGTSLSFIVIDKYYKFLQTLVSHKELPDLIIVFDLKTFLVSILFVSIIVGLSAYYYSRKELKSRDVVQSRQFYKYSLFTIKLILWLVSIGLWIFCLINIISNTADKNTDDIIQQTGVILFLLLVHLLFIQLITPKVQMILLKLVSKIKLIKKYPVIVGNYNILLKPTYLKNLHASVIMGITLVSGFLLYVKNIYIGEYADSIKEANFSFITYLSAPILIILANTISITILSSNQDKKELFQLKVLGVSNKHLVVIKFAEAFIHSLMIFIISFLFNLIILFLVIFSVHLLGHQIKSLNSIWLPNLVLSGIVCLFYWSTKSIKLFFNHGEEKRNG